MTTLVASFVAIALAIAAMALGVLFGRSPISGSCGGIAGAGCAACSGRCERSRAREGDARSREDDAC